MDRYGGKNVMACGLALWSLATVLTPWAARQSVLALIAMRILMGVSEGVAMPAMNNMLTRYAMNQIPYIFPSIEPQVWLLFVLGNEWGTSLWRNPSFVFLHPKKKNSTSFLIMNDEQCCEMMPLL